MGWIGWLFIAWAEGKIHFADSQLSLDLLSRIPLAVTRKTPSLTVTEIFSRNRELISDVHDMVPQLMLDCNYFVAVFENESGQKNTSMMGSRKALSRRLSLLDIAIDFCRTYFMFNSAEALLSRTPRSKQFVFLVAANLDHILRKSCQTMQSFSQGDGASLRDEDLLSCISEYCVLPGLNFLRERLADGVLRITSQEYHCRNLLEDESGFADKDDEECIESDASCIGEAS